jgi:hypothetical protein
VSSFGLVKFFTRVLLEDYLKQYYHMNITSLEFKTKISGLFIGVNHFSEPSGSGTGLQGSGSDAGVQSSGSGSGGQGSGSGSGGRITVESLLNVDVNELGVTSTQ